MHCLKEIPFTLDPSKIMSAAHVEAGSDDSEDLLSLIALANSIGKPKAAYTVSFVTARTIDTVTIDEVQFESRTLAHNLASVERAFPMVATCGHEMDEGFPAKGDMLMEFWWELIKSRLLAAAGALLSQHLHQKYRLGKTATMRPGSGDASIWPIQQQKGLFALLPDLDGKIGVRLTDSCLMLPNKTSSGVLFPTEIDFRSCEVCHREPCPGRHAPFNQALWDEIQHD